MRYLRHPLAQFLAISVVLVGGIAVATTVLAAQAANDEALADARGTTAVLARSVAEPAIPRGLVDGNAAALDRFDREVLDRLLIGTTPAPTGTT